MAIIILTISKKYFYKNVLLQSKSINTVFSKNTVNESFGKTLNETYNNISQEYIKKESFDKNFISSSPKIKNDMKENNKKELPDENFIVARYHTRNNSISSSPKIENNKKELPDENFIVARYHTRNNSISSSSKIENNKKELHDENFIVDRYHTKNNSISSLPKIEKGVDKSDIKKTFEDIPLMQNPIIVKKDENTKNYANKSFDKSKKRIHIRLSPSNKTIF